MNLALQIEFLDLFDQERALVKSHLSPKLILHNKLGLQAQN